MLPRVCRIVRRVWPIHPTVVLLYSLCCDIDRLSWFPIALCLRLSLYLIISCAGLFYLYVTFQYNVVSPSPFSRLFHASPLTNRRLTTNGRC